MAFRVRPYRFLTNSSVYHLTNYRNYFITMGTDEKIDRFCLSGALCTYFKSSFRLANNLSVTSKQIPTFLKVWEISETGTPLELACIAAPSLFLTKIIIDEEKVSSGVGVKLSES